MGWIRRETEKGTTQYICPNCHDYHEFREDFGEQTFNENFIFCRRCGARNGTGTAPTLTPPNEPLTMEELRKMDGEPVYMTFPSDTGNQCGHWALVGTQRWGAVSLIYGCGWSSYESAVETLGAKFYRRPPEGKADA